MIIKISIPNIKINHFKINKRKKVLVKINNKLNLNNHKSYMKIIIKKNRLIVIIIKAIKILQKIKMLMIK